MLEQLMGLIQDNAQEAVVKNPAVPNEHNNDVMQTMMGSIMGGLQQEAQSGNMSGLIGLLSGQSVKGDTSGIMNNPIVSNIATTAVQNIMEKFGLSGTAAKSIVASVLPAVLSSFIGKISNPNDKSIDFNDLLGNLMGGSANASAGVQSGGFDFNQIGYAMADGKLDMNDLMRMGGSLLGGGNQSAPGKKDEGGLDLGGMLGGLFGK